MDFKKDNFRERFMQRRSDNQSQLTTEKRNINPMNQGRDAFNQGQDWYNRGIPLENAPDYLRNNMEFIKGYNRKKQLDSITNNNN